jgi:plastocyanin
MKKNLILPAALFISIIAVFSCGKSNNPYTNPSGPTGPTGFATDSINMSGMRYSPAIDTVHVGATVKWKNLDGYNHTVTSDDGTTFGSPGPAIPSGTIFTFTPTTTGTFTYHCQYHQSMGMVGTLIVKP